MAERITIYVPDSGLLAAVHDAAEEQEISVSKFACELFSEALRYEQQQRAFTPHRSKLAAARDSR